MSILIIGLLIWWVYSKYGYLINSYQNSPSKVTVDNVPIDLPSTIADDPSLSGIKLQAGYQINYFAKNVPGARSLAVGDNGVIYVGTRGEGVVYALEDSDKDGVANKRYVVASGLSSPNGVVYHDDSLYVAEIGRIIKFANINSTYMEAPQYSVVYSELPKLAHHGWRYMALGPDNKLYLGIGAPCNTCEVSDPYSSISRLNLDGTGFEVVARGIRNTVGFDWNPEDLSLWFTDNGRDELGEDIPKDELNQLKTEGENFGFPYCHDGTILDPVFGKNKNCSDYEEPALHLSPHAAALGMKFVGNKILIAEHGSWNRKIPIGYRLMSVDVEGGVASNYKIFADGWLASNGKTRGRPVDILPQPDNSILVSDDFAGVVYRITQDVQ